MTEEKILHCGRIDPLIGDPSVMVIQELKCQNEEVLAG